MDIFYTGILKTMYTRQSLPI